MTTSDLSGCCKPFGVSKAIAESVYEEFYDQVNKKILKTYVFVLNRRQNFSGIVIGLRVCAHHGL